MLVVVSLWTMCCHTWDSQNQIRMISSQWFYSKQIKNGYECNGPDIFMRWKMECSIQRGEANNDNYNVKNRHRVIARITLIERNLNRLDLLFIKVAEYFAHGVLEGAVSAFLGGDHVSQHSLDLLRPVALVALLLRGHLVLVRNPLQGALGNFQLKAILQSAPVNDRLKKGLMNTMKMMKSNLYKEGLDS